MRRIYIVAIGLAIAAGGFAFALSLYLSEFTDEKCLARNLAWETSALSHAKVGLAKYRADAEIEAIIHVVLNRVRLGQKAGYANTVCGVINQHAQFSWTREKSLTARPKSKKRWEYMLAAARRGLSGEFTYPWPKENDCVTNYKRADNKGVGRRSMRWFYRHQRPIGVWGDHRFYCVKQKPKKVVATRKGSG